MPLMPKRVKYRKQSKGNRGGWATSGAELAYGEFGLKATTRGFLTATQIEACRVAINREMKRKGKLWIRMFPDKPVTRKPGWPSCSPARCCSRSAACPRRWRASASASPPRRSASTRSSSRVQE